MTRWKVLAAALAISACSAVHGASVTITWNNPVFNPSPGVNVGTVSSPAGSTGADAGRFKGVASNLVGINPSEFYLNVNSVFAYCFDLAQTLSGGASINYTIQPGANAAALDFLGAANAVLGGGDFGWLNPADSNTAAAVQIGLWEALYGDDFATGTGAVQFSAVPGSVATIFNSIVSAMTSSADLDASRVMRLVSETNQDVITGRLGRFVPEPGSLALIGLAAAVAGFVRRRKS